MTLIVNKSRWAVFSKRKFSKDFAAECWMLCVYAVIKNCALIYIIKFDKMKILLVVYCDSFHSNSFSLFYIRKIISLVCYKVLSYYFWNLVEYIKSFSWWKTTQDLKNFETFSFLIHLTQSFLSVLLLEIFWFLCILKIVVFYVFKMCVCKLQTFPALITWQ